MPPPARPSSSSASVTRAARRSTWTPSASCGVTADPRPRRRPAPSCPRSWPAGAPNDLFASLLGNQIAYRSTGLSLPSLIQVNRTEVQPFTRTEDIRQRDAGSAVDQLVVDGSNDSGLSGTLDTTRIATTQLAGGKIVFKAGTRTDSYASPITSATLTLTAAPVDDQLVSAVAFL